MNVPKPAPDVPKRAYPDRVAILSFYGTAVVRSAPISPSMEVSMSRRVKKLAAVFVVCVALAASGCASVTGPSADGCTGTQNSSTQCLDGTQNSGT
jgi:hypothetical protein